MSFRVYARRVRDHDLPFGRRCRALRDAVGCYCPLGFHGTWSYLSTAGDLRNDETALLHALEKLEGSRTVWLQEVASFADRRRVDKTRHHRTPRQAEVRYLLGWRWPGPDGKQAMLGEVGRLWATHRRSPFPDVPAGTKGDLVELDTWLAGCVSTYLANDGDLDQGRQNVITKCLPKLRRYVAQLGYPWSFPEAFAYFRLLLKMTELIHNDKAQQGGG
ncbi:hypothetical protein ACF060_32950 [Streptomyces werraensis]|uniref:hypothetical protein n=1 Tax=Streptomyces werraensis TaxID=68284 RepID=UPI003701DBA2